MVIDEGKGLSTEEQQYDPTSTAAGRRLFELIEHVGFDDPVRASVAGEQHDVAVAWTRAVVQFRPIPAVLKAIRNLVQVRADGDGR